MKLEQKIILWYWKYCWLKLLSFFELFPLTWRIHVNNLRPCPETTYPFCFCLFFYKEVQFRVEKRPPPALILHQSGRDSMLQNLTVVYMLHIIILHMLGATQSAGAHDVRNRPATCCTPEVFNILVQVASYVISFNFVPVKFVSVNSSYLQSLIYN
jgi:hypothetical protein